MHALVHILASAVYAATKSGISQLGESRHRELTGTGVRVVTAYPGATGARRHARPAKPAKHEINTAPEDRREMQNLNITNLMAVDATLAPGLDPWNRPSATTAASSAAQHARQHLAWVTHQCRMAVPFGRDGGEGSADTDKFLVHELVGTEAPEFAPETAPFHSAER